MSRSADATGAGSVRFFLKLSIAAAVATIALKTWAWWLTGSVGLLSDAMESFVNLASALFAFAMVSVAERPADEGHPFGHTKAEYFSSGFEGLLIVGAAVAIIWAAVPRFAAPQAIESVGLGLAITVFSSGINLALGWRMLAASRAQGSIVLEADGRHLLADVWTSAGVVVGVALVHFTGWLWLDPAIAVLVALNILREGGLLAWRSVDGLMDAAVEPEVRARIDATLARFAAPGIRFDHAITRGAGQRRFIDVHLHVPAAWTLGRADALRAEVEGALMREVPGLRVSIQLLPIDVETRSVGDYA